MKKVKFAIIILFSISISSCLSSIFSGAQIVYDRNSIQRSIKNHQLQVKANHALFDRWPHLKQANISVIAYNNDLILIGQVPTKKDFIQVTQILKSVKGSRRVFNELTIGKNSSIGQSIKDTWLTSKIRARMVAENGLDPSQFKIVTEKNVVYILGDVKEDQANKVVELVQTTAGVTKIIRVLRYYKYT